MSADGEHALTLIAMLGSVFSPHYARARQRPGGAHPLDHSAMNVALYGPRASWCLTERPRGSVERSASELRLGPNTLRWSEGELVVELDEVVSPYMVPSLGRRRVRGQVRLTPRFCTSEPVDLDGRGRHAWHPIAPVCDAVVELESPGVSFRGSGYLDTNRGVEPLEQGFSWWSWSRSAHDDEPVTTYDAIRKDGSRISDARRHGPSGSEEVPGLAPVALPRSRWGLPRTVLADPGTRARVLKDLEDTPFYGRSLIESTVAGKRAVSVYEALSCDRFASPLVQWMLPYRMRREGA